MTKRTIYISIASAILALLSFTGGMVVASPTVQGDQTIQLRPGDRLFVEVLEDDPTATETETASPTSTDTPSETNTSTETATDTPTSTVTETETDTDTIWWTDPPTSTPRPTYTPRPTLPPVTDTPEPTYTPYVPPTHPIYRSQYRNYADPLTMFNASNYGRDVAPSPGYNYATGSQNMGIDQLNQNLRSFADQQMAQTYPDGSPKGADMNAVLAEMRKYGLTATDLENARYGRTTGLNTPFSQYNKERPTARTFGGGISELIKKLPT